MGELFRMSPLRRKSIEDLREKEVLMEEGNGQEAKGSSRGLNLTELIPEHFERFFVFFQKGHNEGIVPARIKELARLKIAALNQCDT